MLVVTAVVFKEEEKQINCLLFLILVYISLKWLFVHTTWYARAAAQHKLYFSDGFTVSIQPLYVAKKKFRWILETNSDQLDMTFFGKTDTNTFLFIWQNRSQSVYTCSDGSSKHLNGLLIHLKKHRFNALAKTLILNSLLILVNGNLVNGVSVIRIVWSSGWG